MAWATWPAGINTPMGILRSTYPGSSDSEQVLDALPGISVTDISALRMATPGSTRRWLPGFGYDASACRRLWRGVGCEEQPQMLFIAEQPQSVLQDGVAGGLACVLGDGVALSDPGNAERGVDLVR